MPYEVDVATYSIAQYDPNLIPFTSFESASTEAIEDFNESAQEALDDIASSLSDTTGELNTLVESASTSATSAAASASEAAEISGLDDVSGAVSILTSNVAFEATFNDSISINKGYGSYDEIDVSAAQDGSVMVDLPSKSVSYSRASTSSVKSKSGYLNSLGIDEPAIGSDGIWAHGEYQNELLYTEDFSNSEWTKVGTCTVSSSTEADPEGGSNASLIVDCDSFANRLTQSIADSIDDQDPMYGSIWVKGEGSVTLTLQSGSSQDFTLTGLWQEISMSTYSSSGLGELRVHGAGGTDSFYVYAAQISKSLVKLPYSKNEGTVVVKPETEMSIVTKGNFPEYGVPFAVEVDCAIPSLGRDTRVFSQLNTFYLRKAGSGSVSASITNVAGTSNTTTPRAIDSERHKFVVRVGLSQVDLFVDGELSASSPTYTKMPVVNFDSDLQLGNYGGAVDFHLDSQMKNFRIHHGNVTDDTIKSWGKAL